MEAASTNDEKNCTSTTASWHAADLHDDEPGGGSDGGGRDDAGSKVEPLRILMSSLSHYGRAQSLMAIASELVRRGHDVTFAIGSDFVDRLRGIATGDLASRVNIVEVGGNRGGNDGLKDQLLTKATRPENTDTLSILRLVLEKFAKDGRESAPLYLDFLERHDFDVIVADVTAYGLLWANLMLEARHQRGIPVVMNCPILAQGELLQIEGQGGYYPTSNERNLYDISFRARSKNVVSRRIKSQAARYLVSKTNKPKWEELGIPGSGVLPRKNPILVGTAFGFEVPHEVPPHIIHAGPMIDLSVVPRELADRDANVLWASDVETCPGGVFLVSLGTSVTLGADEVNSVGRALHSAATDLPTVCFLWSLRRQQQDMLDEDVSGAIRDLSPRFRLEPFVSMRLFLRWAPVVGQMTHGGVASVSESLYFGVPLVVTPFLFDQVDLAARVHHAGAGIDVGPSRPHDPDEIRRAIGKVVSEERYRLGAERIGRIFRRAGGVRRAADVVEDVSLMGSRYLMPPTYRENVPWYVHGDTDVVVVLTTIGWVVFVAIAKALMFVIRRCRGGHSKAKTKVQ